MGTDSSVLGVNGYAHDAGVALVRDGRIIQVHEEERFDRVRKTSAFPVESLQFLQASAELDPSQIRKIGFPWHPYRVAKMVWALVFDSFPPAYRLLTRQASPRMNVPAALRFLGVRRAVSRALGGRVSGQVRFVPHHLAHACNAYFLSPFDEAVVLVMDGFGDECSTSSFVARGGCLEHLRKNDPLNSLGVLYAVVTKHLGYQTVTGEGTVMALSSHGADDLVEKFREVIHLHHDGTYSVDDRFFSYRRYGELRPVSDHFVRAFGPPRRPGGPVLDRHRALAHALQRRTEEVVLNAVQALKRETGISSVCFSGGVALNCLVNGRVAREGGFQRLFVSPNPNDAGQALGAALAITHLNEPRSHPASVQTAFLGASYSSDEIRNELVSSCVRWEQREDFVDVAAREIAAGRIVAWYQGASEMGPRALGNRSLLADPRSSDVVGRLNRIKAREDFRPFAPSVIADRAPEYFEGVVDSPYMSLAFRVKEGRREEISAVLARDGTARVHTVTQSQSPLFWRLIKAFESRTGVPMLLNTSYNTDGPIVGSPGDALRTFERSSIDLLVLGDYVVRRHVA